MWAGPPSWDPIVLGEDDEDDDDNGYAYGDIKWVLPLSTQYRVARSVVEKSFVESLLCPARWRATAVAALVPHCIGKQNIPI